MYIRYILYILYIGRTPYTYYILYIILYNILYYFLSYNSINSIIAYATFTNSLNSTLSSYNIYIIKSITLTSFYLSLSLNFFNIFKLFTKSIVSLSLFAFINKIILFLCFYYVKKRLIHIILVNSLSY